MFQRKNRFLISGKENNRKTRKENFGGKSRKENKRISRRKVQEQGFGDQMFVLEP